jgi:hypothetical protein
MKYVMKEEAFDFAGLLSRGVKVAGWLHFRAVEV